MMLQLGARNCQTPAIRKAPGKKGGKLKFLYQAPKIQKVLAFIYFNKKTPMEGGVLLRKNVLLRKKQDGPVCF